MSDDLVKALRRIAKISYGATIDEARSVSKTQRDAAALIEQQAKDLTALREDIEAQIRIASEEATLANACLGLLRQIASLKRYNANVGITRQPATRWTINVPVDLMKRVDAALAQKQEGCQLDRGEEDAG